jgi:hypothetical protein
LNDEDCTAVDEQKKSGVDLFYLRGIYAIVKVGREYTMGDQSGRPLCCVKDANKQEENDIYVSYRGRTAEFRRDAIDKHHDLIG